MIRVALLCLALSACAVSDQRAALQVATLVAQNYTTALNIFETIRSTL